MAFILPSSPSTLRPSSSSFMSPRTTTTVSHVVRARVHMTALDEPKTTRQPDTARHSRPVAIASEEAHAGFCSINPRTGKRVVMSLREKEHMFLAAMQGHFDGDTIMSNDNFDSLKEELMWEGSEVVMLSRDAFRFLDAARSYDEGEPVMSDEELDSLKKELFEAGSVVAMAQGPRCSLKRKTAYSNIIPDKRRTLALYAPAALLMSLVWLSMAFELTPLHQVDPVLTLLIGAPAIYIASRLLTGLLVRNAQIMVGDCPSCGHRTHVLFGDVLNQEGFHSDADVKCSKCKAELKVDRENSKMTVVEEGT